MLETAIKWGVAGSGCHTLARKSCYTYPKKLLHLSEITATLTRKNILVVLAFSIMRKFKNNAECGACRDGCHIFGVRQPYIIVYGG